MSEVLYERLPTADMANHVVDVETQHRDHMRQAGSAVLDRVLAAKQMGHDPYQLDQPSSVRKHPIDTTDPDVAAFGAFLERHRVVGLTVLFALCQGTAWVCMRVSDSMYTSLH